MYFTLENLDVKQTWILDPERGLPADGLCIPEQGRYRFTPSRNAKAERNAEIEVCLDGTSIRELSNRFGTVAPAKDFDLRKEDPNFPSAHYFESKAGRVKISLRERRDGTWGELLCTHLTVAPTKLGGPEAYCRLLADLSKAPPPLQIDPSELTSHLYERWCSLRLLTGLQEVIGTELIHRPPERNVPDAISGFFAGPVFEVMLSPQRKLRMRCEPLVKTKSLAFQRADALYVTRCDPSNPLRPDLTVELMEQRRGSWEVARAVVADVKYCAEGPVGILKRWAKIDRKYGQIAGLRGREVLHGLWLMTPGKPSAIIDGPLNIGVDNVFSADVGWGFQPRPYERKQMLVTPSADSAAYFTAAAHQMLETLQA